MSEPRPAPDVLRRAVRLEAIGSRAVAPYLLRPAERAPYGYDPLDDAPRDPLPIRRVLGLDCEMVMTAQGACLARVSLVELAAPGADGRRRRWPADAAGPSAALDWAPDVLLDLLIAPPAPVTDYLTPHSGITAELLADATATAGDARAAIAEILGADDALCGHDLTRDLAMLGLEWPWILDTSVLYPHHEGPPRRHALRFLVAIGLGRTIQERAHSSVEDAGAALELARRQIDGGQGRLVWSPLPPDAPVVHPTMDLETACRLVGLPAEMVRCAWPRGSRAVGYAGVRPDGSVSDWDFVFVTDRGFGAKDDVHLSSGNLDITVYDEDTFRWRIERCSIWELESLYADRSLFLREQIDFRAHFAGWRDRAPAALLHSRLRRSVLYESRRKWAQAETWMSQRGDGYGARKRLFIALRALAYGQQILERGSIYDVGCLNDLWRDQLKHDPAETWAALEATYGPRYRAALDAFQAETPRHPRRGRAVEGADGDRRAQTALRAAMDDRWRAGISRPADARPPEDLGSAGLDIEPLRQTLAFLRAVTDTGRSPSAALDALHETWGIAARHHRDHPGLVQLRYTPRARPRGHPIVCACRGLILDALAGWAPVVYPFPRFFNLQEPESQRDAMDWSTAVVSEKLDGSLAILYRYADRWQVASSRRPDASGRLGLRGGADGVPFQELFWRIWTDLGYQLPPDDSDAIYLFELTSRSHAVVVRYPDERLTLIGARDMRALRELDPASVAPRFGWRSALAEPLPPAPDPARALQARAGALDGGLQEGFVVRDAAWRRVKVKSPEYLKLAWMYPICPTRYALNDRRILTIILSGGADEFQSMFPEYREQMAAGIARWDRAVATIEAAYAPIAGLADMRAFAAAAQRYPFASGLFAMRRRGVRADEWLRGLGVKKIERLLGRI